MQLLLQLFHLFVLVFNVLKSLGRSSKIAELIPSDNKDSVMQLEALKRFFSY